MKDKKNQEDSYSVLRKRNGKPGRREKKFQVKERINNEDIKRKFERTPPARAHH